MVCVRDRSRRKQREKLHYQEARDQVIISERGNRHGQASESSTGLNTFAIYLCHRSGFTAG